MLGTKWKPRKQSLATPKPKTEDERAACEAANRKSRLLRLPPELRNRIYEFALPYRQDLRSSICWQQRKIFAQCLLLHASRQLRREALSLFASSNLFELRLHFGKLHSLSMMNVLCLDPIVADSLQNLEVVSSFACSHAHTMVPFFGCVSVFVDRGEGTITRTDDSNWANQMECDQNLKYGVVGEKCHRVREENVARLLLEVEAAGLHVKERGVRKVDLEELAAKMGRKGKKEKRGGVIMPSINAVGRALKREGSVVGGALERYRDTKSFLG